MNLDQTFRPALGASGLVRKLVQKIYAKGGPARPIGLAFSPHEKLLRRRWEITPPLALRFPTDCRSPCEITPRRFGNYSAPLPQHTRVSNTLGSQGRAE